MMNILSKNIFVELMIFVFSIGVVSESTLAESTGIDRIHASNVLCKQGIDTITNDVSVFLVKAIDNIPVYSDDHPEDLRVEGCDMQITAAKGEYEPASFVIRPNIELGNKIKIIASPLVGAHGTIPAANVEIKSVKIWYQASGAWKHVGGAGSDEVVLVPELLLNDDEVIRVDKKGKFNSLRVNTSNGIRYIPKNSKEKLKKMVKDLSPEYQLVDAPVLQPVQININENKQMWVTVYVPECASAGEYTGEISILSGVREIAKIPVRLKVLPLKLAEPKLEYGIYYHGRLHPSREESLSSDYKSPKQLRVELTDLLQHGFNNPIIYQYHKKYIHLLAEYLSIRESLGMDNSKLYFMWLNTNNVKSTKQIYELQSDISDLKTFLKSYGTKEIYVYGKDEAKGDKLLQQKKAWESIREVGVKVYAAGYKGTFEAIGESLDLFVFARSPMQDEANKFHSVNHKIFSYANPQSGVENPYLYRRNYGLVLWASGFDGAMVYAYQHSMGDAWNDSDHSVYRDHNFTYPTSDGIIKTIAWEGMREAIDDVRYLTTLEHEIDKVRLIEGGKVNELVKSAEDYMQTLKDEANKHNRYGINTSEFDIDLDDVRKKTIRYLTELNELSKQSEKETRSYPTETL